MIVNKKAMTMMLLMSSMTGMVGSSALMFPTTAHAQVQNQKLDPIGMNYNQSFTNLKDALDLHKVLAGRYTTDQIDSMSIEDIHIYTYDNYQGDPSFKTVQDALNSGITNDDIIKGGFVSDLRRSGYFVRNGGVSYTIKGNFLNGDQSVYLQPYIYEEINIDKEFAVRGAVPGTKKYTIEELTNGKFNSRDWEIVRYNGKNQAPGITSQEITLSPGQVVTWDMVIKPKKNLTQLWKTDQAQVKHILAAAGASTTEYKNASVIDGPYDLEIYPSYPNKPGEFIYIGEYNDQSEEGLGVISTFHEILDIVEDPIVSLKGSISDATPTPATTSTINPDTPVSLTIHKHLGDPTGQSADGEEKQVNRQKLSDVKFEVRKIDGLDPKKIDDWKKYASLSSGGSYGLNEFYIDSKIKELGDGYSLGRPQTVTTDKNGVAKLEYLTQGFYYVSEVEDYENHPNRTIAAPSLIALPMTNPSGNSWNYNVHIHPKNQDLMATKEVSDQGVALNEGKITYTIRGDVPALQSVGGSYNYYSIDDSYDEDSVDPIIDSVKVTFVKPGDPNLETGDIPYTELTELEKGTDYTVSGDDNINISLEDSGLKKLADYRSAEGNSELKVQLQFDAKVKSIPDAGEDDQIRVINKAMIYPPHHPSVQMKMIPTNEVETRFVNYDLYKVDGDSREVLPGAEFELHRCEGSEGSPRGFAPSAHDQLLAQEQKLLPEELNEVVPQMDQSDSPSEVIKNSKVRVDGKDKWVTDENGKLSINGVQASNFWNNDSHDNDWVYCLVEVKAPKGYELNPKPIKLYGHGDFSGDNGINPNANEVIVPNYPGNGGFQLPVTGAQGIMWLALGALTIAGVTYLVMGRRNRDE